MFEWSRDGLAIICAAVLSIAGSAASAADEVRVYKSFSVNDGPSVECPTPLLFDEGEPITIDVTPNPNCCDPVDPCCCGVVTMIRIVAEQSGTRYDLGPITITGSRFVTETLKVLIAGSGVLEFPENLRLPLAPGAHHWAGIIANSDILRNEIVLAASITGNLDGPTGSKVSVGAVARLQVVNELDSHTVGNINIPVEAWSGNRSEAGNASIGYIAASYSISADILCRHHEGGSSPVVSTINSVQVGPSAAAAGITGRIQAPYGAIRDLRSSGPIDIPSTTEFPYGILAGGQMDNFDSGIGFLMVGVPSTSAPGWPDPSLPRNLDAAVGCITPLGSGGALLEDLRVSGDVTEPIVADAVGYKYNTGSPDRTDRGIYISGEMHAPIIILNSVYLANIEAATFGEDAHITIGNHLKGRVEAISYAIENGQPVAVPGVLRTVSVGRYPPSPLVYASPGMNGYTATYDPESVIRAGTIESVDIFRVERNSKSNRAAISADRIDEIAIDHFDNGIIAGWTLDPEESNPPRAEIGNAWFGEISRSNDYRPDPPVAWIESFDTFVVEGDCQGHLHFRSIPSDRVVNIGGGLLCGYCNAPVWSINDDGVIFVDDAEALAGQIILNGVPTSTGNPDPSVYCRGQVIVSTSTTPISLSVAPSTDDINTMPEYTRTSGTLGGGAVGLAPFYLYDEDCLPVNDDAAPTITIREFDRTNPLATPRSVKLRFYGPVRVNHATESPVKLTLLRFANGIWHESPISPSRFTVNVKRTTDPGFSREVEIHGNGTWKFPAGWYKVEPVNTGAAALRSDLVDSQPLVRDFEYFFELMPDPASTLTGYDLDEGCDCPADFNQDGGVDGSDVEAFLIAWEIGESDGDVNCDGGVDGSDVETFFYYWEDGGCD